MTFTEAELLTVGLYFALSWIPHHQANPVKAIFVGAFVGPFAYLAGSLQVWGCWATALLVYGAVMLDKNYSPGRRHRGGFLRHHHR